MKTKKILILDDEARFLAQAKKRLRALPVVTKRFEVPDFTKEQFQEALKALNKRRSEAIAAKGIEDFKEPCAFDDAAVLIIDWDLLNLTDTGGLTGENVARMARCYSTCGFILAANQFGENPFDLTLRGHPESWADLNIGIRQLDNKGLWSDASESFRPWHWPIIPSACDALEARVKELSNAMDQPIFKFLGIPERVVQLMPRMAIEFITKKKDAADFSQTTFREFLHDASGGLSAKEKTSKTCEVRIAAARIGKWIERHLLAGQNILIDAPHLAERFPSLISGKPVKAKLDGLAAFDDPAALPIDSKKISKHLFPKKNWISRPSWFWEEIKSSIQEPWSGEELKFVFCEDVSAFFPRKDCRPFVADLPSPFVQRYVKEVGHQVGYEPQVRFSL